MPPPLISPSVPDLDTSPVASNISQSESFNSTQVRELTVDDIEDFEDDDLDETDSLRISRRTRNDAADLTLGLPSFKTGKSLFKSRLMCMCMLPRYYVLLQGSIFGWLNKEVFSGMLR